MKEIPSGLAGRFEDIVYIRLMTALGMIFLFFAVFSVLLVLFISFNILNIEPLMGDLSHEGDGQSIAELLELLVERYKIPADVQLIGSMYFDRYPDYYFPESEEKNLFRLLNIALYWGLSEKSGFYISELGKIAESSSQPLLKYRIYIHIAIYYSYSAGEGSGNSKNLELFRYYLDKARNIPIAENQRVDLYYYYAYYFYLKKDYRNSIIYLNRTFSDERFIDARLLQLLVFVSIDQNYYFYRMEAYKLTGNIINNPDSDEMLILTIIKLLTQEMAKEIHNPFFNYFLSIYYERLNDIDMALKSAREFEREYKKPVFDYFIEDNKHRIKELERLQKKEEAI